MGRRKPGGCSRLLAASESCALYAGTGLSREHGRSPCQTTPFHGLANSRGKRVPTGSSGSYGSKQPFASDRYRPGLGELCLGQRPQSGGLSEFEHLNTILITDAGTLAARIVPLPQRSLMPSITCISRLHTERAGQADQEDSGAQLWSQLPIPHPD
jgi:hypothetical protein